MERPNPGGTLWSISLWLPFTRLPLCSVFTDRAAVLRMPILLTEAQRHELDTRGWFVVERVLQGAELERVSAAFDEVADRKRALDGLDDGVTGASSTTAR